MSYNRKQFEDLIRRTLTAVDPELCSDAAVNLLLGTAAQESQFGHYLKQIVGPAIGCFQMEPATFRWIQQKYENEYTVVKFRTAEAMEYDLRLAIIMCRLRYRPIAKALPEADDLPGLALYYKTYYNSVAGKATVEEFITNYKTFVK